MEKNKKILLGIMIGLVVVLLTSVILVSKPKKTNELPIVDDEQTTVENDNDNKNIIEDEDKSNNNNEEEEDIKNNTEEINYNYANLDCKELSDKYCLFNDNNQKIELTGEYTGVFEIITINGNKVAPKFLYENFILDRKNETKEIIDTHEYSSYYISDVKVLYDDYVLIMYDVQGHGPNRKAIIVDSNGNIITNTNDLDVLIDYVEFENNILTARFTKFIDGLNLACTYKNENNYSYNDIIEKSYTFEYIGNGLIKQTDSSSMTFEELLINETGFNNCDDWKANNYNHK